MSRHTKEERNKSKNQFTERLGQRFDKKAAQYIANFEGMESGSDNDLEDENLDEIEVLIINILSPPSATLNDKNSETFFTLLGFVKKAEEMTTNLANRSFNHFLFTIGNVLPNYMNSVYAAYDLIDTNLLLILPSTNTHLTNSIGL